MSGGTVKRWSILMLTLTGCADAAAAQDLPLSVLSEQARTIAMEHCGKCHGNAEHAGVEDALAVFDLNEKRWFQNLDKEQLASAMGRMKGKANPADRKRFAAFVKKASRARKEK